MVVTLQVLKSMTSVLAQATASPGPYNAAAAINSDANAPSAYCIYTAHGSPIPPSSKFSTHYTPRVSELSMLRGEELRCWKF